MRPELGMAERQVALAFMDMEDFTLLCPGHRGAPHPREIRHTTRCRRPPSRRKCFLSSSKATFPLTSAMFSK